MQSPSLFFRTAFRSPRLDYILQEVLGRRLEVDYALIGMDEQPPPGKPCLTYGTPGGDADYSDSGILRETGTGNWKMEAEADGPVLIRQQGKIRNDFFGAAFWLLSRYEEYLPVIPDEHGRFPDNAHEVLTLKRDLPLVEIWAEKLRKHLQSLGIQCKKAEPSVDYSIDWDNPTAYLHKGIFRQTGAAASDLLRGNFAGLSERLMVMAGRKADPYDNLGSRIPAELLKGKRIFFWVGDYGIHDKGLSWKNSWYRQQIINLSKEMLPGLHPSYASFEKPEKIAEEKKRLETITGSEIKASRFHFLRFRLPHSYRILEQAGISDDFSMGFSEFPGFRAGTAFPFQWFDLEMNQAGKLLIHPFSLMDSSRAFRGNSNGAFLQESKRQIQEGSKYAFPVSAIFHNEHPHWKGWENTIRAYTEAGLKTLL